MEEWETEGMDQGDISLALQMLLDAAEFSQLIGSVDRYMCNSKKTQMPSIPPS